jgi:hypothetical protein
MSDNRSLPFELLLEVFKCLSLVDLSNMTISKSMNALRQIAFDQNLVLLNNESDIEVAVRNYEKLPRMRQLVHNAFKTATMFVNNETVQRFCNRFIRGGHVDLFRICLLGPIKEQYDPTYDDCYPIYLASRLGSAEMVRLLLLADDSPDLTIDESAMVWACECGHADVVNLLLADGRAKPNARNNSAICRASFNGHTEVVKLLLTDERVDPTAAQNGAIIAASLNGHTEVVRLLLADGRADPSEFGVCALFMTSMSGHTEIMRLLLTDGRVDPTKFGDIAICMASIYGHTDVLELLLADGRADPTALSDLANRRESVIGQAEMVKRRLTNAGYLSEKQKSHMSCVMALEVATAINQN